MSKVTDDLAKHVTFRGPIGRGAAIGAIGGAALSMTNDNMSFGQGIVYGGIIGGVAAGLMRGSAESPAAKAAARTARPVSYGARNVRVGLSGFKGAAVEPAAGVLRQRLTRTAARATRSGVLASLARRRGFHFPA